MPQKNRSGRAFSLIELIVVIALVTALFGVILVSWRGQSRGADLLNAQQMLAGMVAQARAQAVLSAVITSPNQPNVRILIYGTQPPTGEASKFLRMCRIVRLMNTSGTWQEVGDPITLPSGVCIVPRVMSTSLLESGLRWPTGNYQPLSDLSGPSRITLVNQQSMFPTSYYIDFYPDGHVLGNGKSSATTTLKLAVASTTDNATTGPRFNNIAAIRGLLIRPTGAVQFVNDPNGF